MIIIVLYTSSVGQAEISEATRAMAAGPGGGVRGLAGQCGKQEDVRGLEATGIAVECEKEYCVCVCGSFKRLNSNIKGGENYVCLFFLIRILRLKRLIFCVDDITFICSRL